MSALSAARNAISTGEYAAGPAHTNSIESVWAVLKRGYYGIYHSMSAKHLARYVNWVCNGEKG